MKKHSIVLSLAGFIALLLCFQGCNDQEAPHNQAPVLTTGSATVTGRTTATLNGTLSIPTGTEVTECGFIYSTVSTLPEAESTVYPLDPSQANGECTAHLTGLQPNTHYFYCLYASSGYTVLRSNINEFTTNADGVPAFAEVVCTDITASSVTLQGELTDDGGYEILTLGFCYKVMEEGDEDAPDQEDQVINVSTDSHMFTVTLQGLTPEQTYSVRAYATNQLGAGYSELTTFSTQSSSVPVLSSVTPTDTIELSLQVKASLIAAGDGEVSEIGFCWSAESNSPTTEMNHQACNEQLGAENFGLLIENLLPETVYYIRAYGINEHGTGYGPIFTYTTGQSALPVAETGEAEAITETTARLTGRVISNGGSSLISKGFYYSTDVENVTNGTRCYSTTEGDGIVCELADLAVATTYYYCAYAENANGIRTGDVLSFTTAGQRTIPTVQTTETSNLGETSARLNGRITSDGHSPILSKGFYWGTDSQPVQNGAQVVSASEGNSFLYDLGNLTAGTTYYVCAYAENGEGTGYGEVVSFSTQAATTAPTIGTTTVSDITETGASLTAEITSDGGMEITEKGFCYSSTNAEPSINDSKVTSMTEGNSITGTLNELTANTAYYVRAYATNGKGTSYGAVQQFTTADNRTAPTVGTTTVSNITETGASLTAEITSDGGLEITEKGFCYGTNPDPSTSNSKVTSRAEGNSITATLSGLTSSTTYYVRAYAINSKGTSYGATQQFTTALTLHIPSIGNTSVSNTTTNTASISATITSNGGAEVTEKGFYYGTNNPPTEADTKVISTASGDAITAELTGLSPRTTYYIRAFATNSQGTTLGAVNAFTTADDRTTPSVGSVTASNVTAESVDLIATILDNGGADIAEKGFCYTTDAGTTPTINGNKAVATDEGNAISLTLSNLSPNTTYYIRAYANNGAKIGYSETLTVTTNVSGTPDIDDNPSPDRN